MDEKIPEPKTVEEQCRRLAAKAEEARRDGVYNGVCIAGEAVFFVEHTHGLMPGHIYSKIGLDEFKISRSCEYHFDEWTREPDDGNVS